MPLLLPGRPGWWPVWVIAALALSNVLGQAGTALWQSWMADLIPPERAGRFWGVRQRMLSLAMALSALGFGFLLDHFTRPEHPLLGFTIVFAIAAVFGVTDILMHCTVHEPPPSIIPHRRSVWQRVVAPLQQPGFLRFTLAIGVWTASVAMLGYNQGMPGFFAMVNLKENFGATYSQAALVFVATGLGAALWTPAIGRAIDRWGGRAVMLGLILVGPMLMLAWLGASGTLWRLPGIGAMLPQAVVWMSGASLLLGGIYSSAWVCQVRLTQSLTLPAGRVVAMGLHWSLVGLIGSLGPLGAGWVKDHFKHFGPPAWWSGNYYGLLVLAHLVLAWGLALPLVWGLAKPRPRAPFAKGFR